MRAAPFRAMLHRSRGLLLAAVLVSGIIAAVAFPPARSSAASSWTRATEDVSVGDRTGALLDEVIFVLEQDVGRVPDLIERGKLQLYAAGVPPNVFRRVRSSDRLEYSLSYGSSSDLTFNPVGPTFRDGRLNPFHVEEIREALNWLVDRDHIADELFGGLAVPRYLPMSTVSPEAGRMAGEARALELRYRHDPDRARQIVEQEMDRLGAVRSAGVWTHQGKPVQLTILILDVGSLTRVGDYVADLMQDLGFSVQRIYRTADEVVPVWNSDPAEGRWHILTGAWGSVGVARHESAALRAFFTPQGRAIALWQAYQPDPELSSIADRLVQGGFESLEERQGMLARGLDLAMRNSVRFWITDMISATPRDANVSFAADLAGGFLLSSMWPYTLRYRDRVGGTATVGLSAILVEPWNPVAGTGMAVDVGLLRGIYEFPLLLDPYTGLALPNRVVSAEVTVVEDAPIMHTLDWVTLRRAAEIRVPPDAWIDWHAGAGRWVTVAERHPDGLTARGHVRVHFEPDFLERRWHDGSRYSLADVVLPWIHPFERADTASALYDPSAVAALQAFRRNFRGRRIVSTDPLVIDYFGDQIPLDAEMLVMARLQEGVMRPWHVLALGIRSETQGELAFSSAKADIRKIDWMNLIGGPSLSVLERHLRVAAAREYLPFANVLSEYVRAGEVAERYAALGRWYGERRHFLVGNSPYYLHSVHPLEKTVVLRRFAGYPDRADRWLGFSEPRIPAVAIDGPLLVRTGEPARFDLDIAFQGEPYPAAEIERVRWLLFDSGSRIVAQGDAEVRADGRWVVAVGAEAIAGLGTGASSLEVAVTSSSVGMPTFAGHGFAVLPPALNARADGSQ